MITENNPEIVCLGFWTSDFLRSRLQEILKDYPNIHVFLVRNLNDYGFCKITILFQDKTIKDISDIMDSEIITKVQEMLAQLNN